jgi:hypothetical protein
VLLAAEAHHWYQLTWVDWFSVAGLPLTLVGLGLTWKQAKDAAGAAKAAQEAISATEQKIRSKQLMVLIPQLRWTAVELENAITVKDRIAARRQLDSWRWQAGNVHGILNASDPGAMKILQVLQQSVGLARVAGSALMKEGRSVPASCSEAHSSIVVTCDELNAWLGKNSTEAV